MDDIKNKTIGELEDPAQALQIVFNGYTILEIKKGIDSLVEFGRLMYFVKKYKLMFLIPIGLFSMWFFNLDLATIVKLFK